MPARSVERDAPARPGARPPPRTAADRPVQARRILDAVVDASGDGIVVFAADGRIDLENPIAHGMFTGRAPRTFDDLIGRLAHHGTLDDAFGAHLGPLVVATEADPDRWIEFTTSPVHAARPPQTLLVLRDVTDDRRRTAVRETLIGVLSHELRTPLTTIYGGAKLLARPDSTLDEPTRQSIFTDIHDEAERLQRLVEDIVALNRFGDAAGEIGAEPVLLQRLLPPLVASEAGRWPGVTFSLRVEADLPTVSAEPSYVEQVVRNLLSNAAKYGGPGTTVVLAAVAAHGDVSVVALDDGPGFPPDEAGRLFELFYRSPATAGAAAGAGIGLFVCARLIDAMGGRMWARTRSEGGGEFGFALRPFEEWPAA